MCGVGGGSLRGRDNLRNIDKGSGREWYLEKVLGKKQDLKRTNSKGTDR